MHIFSTQTFYFRQDLAVLDLLRVRLGPTADCTKRSVFNVWSRGASHRVTGTNIENVIAKLSKITFNQITDRSITQMPYEWVPGVIVTFLSISLELSPNNALWGRLTELSPSSQENARSMWTFDSFEKSLEYHGVKNCPSVLEAYFEGTCNKPTSVVIDHLFNYLARMPLRDDFRAYIDFEEKDDRQIAPRVLASVPSDLLCQLQSRIDGLHNVIVASKALCEQLVSALSGAAVHRNFPRNSNLGWLQLNDDAWRHWKALENKISQWIVKV